MRREEASFWAQLAEETAVEEAPDTMDCMSFPMLPTSGAEPARETWKQQNAWRDHETGVIGVNVVISGGGEE